MRYSHQTEQSHCHCLPLGFRSVRRGHTRNGSVVERLLVGWSCAVFGMEGGGGGDDGSEGNGGRGEAFSEEEVRGSSESSESSVSTSVRESLSSGGFEEPTKSLVSDVGGDGEKAGQVVKPKISDMEMMKERFSKLLLGEDMSGCGNGVSTALAISNSITNLCATIFGQLWRLEPVSPIKKCMWRREMDWLLCVSDHIVELVPSWQTFPDGSKLEIMTCRPRTDLYINLPALRKLDNMLLEILDEFKDPEFWYVDQGVLAPEIDGSASFRRSLKHQEEKWWLPVPRVPSGGLKSKTRKLLQDKRECTNQILKAALAINSNALVEMEVPESYINSLPKNGRASLGDIMYRYIISDQFFPECLLDCLCLSSEYHALEIANRVEASIYIWRRGIATNTKSSWGMVKDLVLDAEKRELLADRAEGLLLCLKQRFPGLTQTALDTSKIQFNKDVGKSILESYSRVLESLAFNIVARIDDLLHVDDLAKHLDQAVGAITYNRVSNPQSVPVSSTPYSTAYATPNFSPAPLISPARTSLIRRKSHSQGFRVKKALTDYLGIDTKAKHDSNISEVSVSIRE